MAKIFVVEPQDEMHEHFSALLESLGHNVEFASDAKDAGNRWKSAKPDVLISDFALPDDDGLALIRQVHEHSPKVPAILMNAMPTRDNAVQALRAGVVDYLRKPIRINELSAAIQRALGNASDEAPSSSDGAGVRYFSGKKCYALIGDSRPMKALRRQVERLSSKENLRIVFMQGEGGTGKEMISRFIHRNSSFSSGDFVSFDCRGASADEVDSKIIGPDEAGGSLFNEASGGSLLLQNVSEIDVDRQTRLASVLDNSKRKMLVMLTSEADVDDLISEEKFSEKLYYKIALEIIQVPPLREHAADIPALAKFVVENNSEQAIRKTTTLDTAATNALKQRDWPGNIFELAEVITAAALRCDGDSITEANLAG